MNTITLQQVEVLKLEGACLSSPLMGLGNGRNVDVFRIEDDYVVRVIGPGSQEVVEYGVLSADAFEELTQQLDGLRVDDYEYVLTMYRAIELLAYDCWPENVAPACIDDE